MTEVVRTTITNWDDTDTVHVSVVPTTDDPTKKGLVVCNADWSSI